MLPVLIMAIAAIVTPSTPSGTLPSVSVKLQIDAEGHVRSCQVVGVRGRVSPATINVQCGLISSKVFSASDNSYGEKEIRGSTVVMDILVSPLHMRR